MISASAINDLAPKYGQAPISLPTDTKSSISQGVYILLNAVDFFLLCSLKYGHFLTYAQK